MRLWSAFLLVAAAIASASPRGRRKTFLELTTALTHGDPCSWEGERLRQEFTIAMLNRSLPIAPRIEKLASFTKLISQGQIPLCSALSLNVCDKVTNRCVCGQPEAVAGLGNLAEFAVEIDEGSALPQCRFARGNYCFNDDFESQMGTASGKDFVKKCQKGTVCRAKREDAGDCSLLGIELFALSNRRVDGLKLAKDLYGGKLCSCEEVVQSIEMEAVTEVNQTGEEEESSTDRDRVDVEYSVRRVKRSPSLSLSFRQDVEVIVGRTAAALLAEQ
jgi:hypothetical protein